MNKYPHTSIFIERVKRISGLEVERAVEAIGGSDELYERMLAQMLRLLPSSARQMDEYIAEGDLGSFGAKAHGLKGSLRQAGCLRLAKAAEALESGAKAGNELLCREQYGPFKDELLCFCRQIDAAFQNAGVDTDAADESEPLCDIAGYIDRLTQVKAAVEDCDSLLAAELLSPVTRKRFGKRADELIKNANEALECFRPDAALEYISDLFNECVDCDN